MYATIALMLDRLECATGSVDALLGWACPVPYFGAIEQSRVATVGINPSNREFVCTQGEELDGGARRLPTLQSLGLRSWTDADANAVRSIAAACSRYFLRNPYDRWFRVLDRALASTPGSYYSRATPACHLDLVPFATCEKWGSVSSSDRDALLQMSAHAVARLLREVPIECLVLNGRSVVTHFERLAGISLAEKAMPAWDLRRNGSSVSGFAYTGRISRFDGWDLEREVRVLGYNHNLQSSFGVTSQAIDAIADWLASEASLQS